MTGAPTPVLLTFPGRLRSDAPGFTALTLMLLLSVVPVLAAMALDTRLFDGDSIWLKPLKFQIALVIYVGTLAFFARFLGQTWQRSPLWSGYVALVILCIVAEVLWIGGAAAMGTASHFNITSPFWNAAYALMGIAAVILTSASLIMGIGIWLNRKTGLAPSLHLSIALGLILTFVLTVPVASTMASSLSHHVGNPVTGARLPVFGWSREVGDLRIAHFFATHALHVVPLSGLTGSRAAVWAAAALWTGLTLWCFARALQGLPPI